MITYIHKITPLILQTVVWIPTRIVLRFFVRFEIKGLENIKDLKAPVIFAANHSSELDPILVTAALPFLSTLSPMFYTAREHKFYDKKGLAALFYGGFFFKIWGAYPVSTGIKDYKKALEYHIEILNKKMGSLCIFPEGRKTKDGKMLEFKGGVAFLSHYTDVPIIPVEISGVFNMGIKDFLFRKRKIVVNFKQIMHVPELFKKEKYKSEEYKKLANEIKKRL